MPGPTLDLDQLVLARGAHHDRSNGLCVMEAAAWLAGEPHTDNPDCVSPAIGVFLRSWNDQLDDTDRQMLKPLIPRVVGTRTSREDEQARAWLATDWLAREFAPAWLDLAGLGEHAGRLRALDALTSTELAERALPIIQEAREASAAARAAAWDAAGAAARDAAGAAAWAAARDAAWDAAWDAARAAAGDAAGAALAPTVKTLQQSALQLVDRMIAVGQVQS